MDWEDILFMNLRIWHMWGNTILWSRRLVNTSVVPICHQWGRQLSKLSLNICIHSRSYPSKSRSKHYASKYLCVHTCLCEQGYTVIHSFIHYLYLHYISCLWYFVVEYLNLLKISLCVKYWETLPWDFLVIPKELQKKTWSYVFMSML